MANQNRWKQWRGALIVPAVFGALILLLALFVPRAFGFIQAPFAAAGTSLGSWWMATFQSSESLREEHQRLKEQMLALARDAALLEQLKDENVQLKSQLAFIERQSFTHITARVLMHANNPLQMHFVIDRGSDDGVSMGAPVIVGEGILTGKVMALTTRTATVLALTDRESKIAASVLNSSRTLGIVEGAGGSLLDLRFIPQDEQVRVNDLVMSSGLEEGIPPGLLIGMINRVAEDRSAPFQEATIEPLIHDRAFTIVSVLVPAVPL